jgi:hypothetical protein
MAAHRPLKTLLSWSSGKDSACTLFTLRLDPRYDVAGLITTMNAEADRVAMHAVRSELLRAQASAAALPLREIPIPSPCSNADYESIMSRFFTEVVREGIECIAFGDLFLEDIRAYREQKMAGTGLTPIFPTLGTRHAHIGRRNDRTAAFAPGSRASIRGRCHLRSPAASSIERSSKISPPLPTHAEKGASFTPSPMPVRCSPHRSQSNAASSSSATVSFSATCCRRDAGWRCRSAPASETVLSASFTSIHSKIDCSDSRVLSPD